MVYSNKPAPNEYILDLIQDKIHEYIGTFDADVQGLAFLPYRPVPSDEMSVPAIYSYQNGSDIDQRGLPERKHKVGTYKVNIEWHTTKQSTWQEEQLINDIIVRNNKVQSTEQFDEDYTDGIDHLIMKSFKHGVITNQDGSFVINYLLAEVELQYQDSYR